MSGMKANLEGLFRNVADSIPAKERSYHAFCLGEVLGHLKAVAKGEHTFAEFAEHYCLVQQSTASATNGKESRSASGSGVTGAPPPDDRSNPVVAGNNSQEARRG